MHTELGKIQSARFGFGGYQDAQIVFEFALGGKGWGVVKTFECGWGHPGEEELRKPDSTYKWTHADRISGIGNAGWEVVQLMKKASVQTLDELVGIPIKAHFDSMGGRIVNFEILEDVL